MFNFLVTQSLKNRLFVLAIAAVLMIYGPSRPRVCPSMSSRISIGPPSRS